MAHCRHFSLNRSARLPSNTFARDRSLPCQGTQTQMDRQDGRDRYSTEVVIPAFGGALTMLDGKSSGSSEIVGVSASGHSSRDGDMNDDIPFLRLR